MKIITPNNITHSTDFKPVTATLMKYRENGEKAGFDTEPRVDIQLNEDLRKYQRGIMRIVIQKGKERISVLVHIDGVMSAIYKAYEVNSQLADILKK